MLYGNIKLKISFYKLNITFVYSAPPIKVVSHPLERNFER